MPKLPGISRTPTPGTAQTARDTADANAHTAEANASNAEANASKATAALALSEANFALAQESVEKYLTTVADSKALLDPDLAETRRQLIQSAREFYEQFISLKADDASSRAKLGTAYGKLAQIAANTDSDTTACAEYASKSRAVFTQLLAEDPANPAYSIGLRVCRVRPRPFPLHSGPPQRSRPPDAVRPGQVSRRRLAGR